MASSPEEPLRLSYGYGEFGCPDSERLRSAGSSFFPGEGPETLVDDEVSAVHGTAQAVLAAPSAEELRTAIISDIEELDRRTADVSGKPYAFVQKAHLYRRATDLCPDARREETAIILAHLAARHPVDPSSPCRPVVVDLFAGQGFLERDLVDAGYKVIALDASPEQLKYLEAMRQRDLGRLGNFITIVQATPYDRSLIDRLGKGSLSAVVTTAGLHHTNSLEQEDMFRIVKELLEPGGHIIGLDVGFHPNANPRVPIDSNSPGNERMRAGTCLSEFFDRVIRKLSILGHDGYWLTEEFLYEQMRQGFTLDFLKTVSTKFYFPDKDTMLYFLRALFAIRPQAESSPISERDLRHYFGYALPGNVSNDPKFTDLFAAALETFLGYEIQEDGSVQLNWPLLSFVLCKTEASK